MQASWLRATSITALVATLAAGAVAPAFAQSTIPANLTSLRPIKCVAYDPKPSDFYQNAYFDSDFFNSDFTAIWGDDGQPGARNDLATFAAAKLNMLHLYNWNGQRTGHTSFLDAAQARGIKVMVPISNFTAGTIVGDTPGCNTCPWGYKAALDLVRGIFNQVYVNGSKTPHPAAAMWGIYNEYDLNKYNPVNVAFVAQAIITLEDEAGIPAANRLPMTTPVSDAMWSTQQRSEAQLPRELNAALSRAATQWLVTNPGKNVSTPNPPDLPGAVLAILAVANALSDAQATTSYQSKFDTAGPVAVSAVPADFWKTRWIASSNPFRFGPALADFVTNPAQFQSAFPGTTAFNTLPPLFFGEMGRSQVDSGNSLTKQAADVLGQIEATDALARNPASTTQGYFLGSCFFQHTYVDTAKYQAFDTSGAFSTRAAAAGAPCPACGQAWRVDELTPLPVWDSVKTGYAQPVLGQGQRSVTVKFVNKCSYSVDVYLSAPDGSSCTKVDTSAPVLPVTAQPNSYSASINGQPSCATGTRVEFTPGANGDVSFDISTNGSWPSQPVPFYNVPARILARQATAPATCSLPEWNGTNAPASLRGVSTKICDSATCPTAYQNPTSGPQFITRDTAAYEYVVEWCPVSGAPSVPTCAATPFNANAPCPSVCLQDAVDSPLPCSTIPDHGMCNVAPFGGIPPASYCLKTSDCSKNGGQSCGCCTSDASCGSGNSCVNFVCSPTQLRRAARS